MASLTLIFLFTERCDSQTQLTCNGGQCISMNWQCDRENDCSDGSDERNCGMQSL